MAAPCGGGAAARLALVVLLGLAGACSAWRPGAAGTLDTAGAPHSRALLGASQQPQPAWSASTAALPRPPSAPKRPFQVTANGDARSDDYYWLRDDGRSSPEVLSYLAAENNYTAAVMAATAGLQARLYQEMRSRVKEDDSSVPSRFKGYWYYTRIAEGQQYAVHCRRAVAPGGAALLEADAPDARLAEQVILDENARKAEGKYSFYMVDTLEPSPDQRLLAWSEDTEGGEKYTLHVKDISSGKEPMEPIPNISGSVVWANDNATLFYILRDDLNRPFKVMRHRVGAPTSDDVVVFEDPDEKFFVGIGRDGSDRLLYIRSGSTVTGETWFLDADNPTGEFKVVLPRVQDVDYSVTHHPGNKPGGDWFLINIRDAAHPNSELRVAPVSNPEDQTVVVAHRANVQVQDATTSLKYIIVGERANASTRVVLHRLPPGGAMPAGPLGEGHVVTFDEDVYTLSGGLTGDFDSDVLRLYYESMTTPPSVIDHHIPSGRRAVRKVRNPVGAFNKDDYASERVWATAPDGTRVPVSLVYRRALFKRDGRAPMLLHGYGAYGMSNDVSFSSTELSLLDRGWVAAVAHVRGGGDMGRLWYEDGKYLNKKNTFTDFIAAAEHLIAANYTSPDLLTIEGRSAGGLLIGATLNMAPGLFRAAIAGVPFVDVLTTMLDESIPLTTTEFEEWGNPADPKYYGYIKSYSPVDNVARQRYPALLVTAGLNDPRVQYWEPAKWVARLRAAKTDANPLLLKTEMGAGHFSVTGRFERLKDDALEYAFLLKAVGQEGVAPLKGTGAGAGGEARAEAAGEV
ncbi:MAG: prolyl oligopeptidase [Monoraphidium minutum]|nr:MAG: prolyl oligopeptidase [Monoraphidium minutum]